MQKMQPHLYGNGGNIIMVQVENEYGSYYACDSDYRLWLRDLLKGYVEDKALLYTIDICRQRDFDCGPIPEVYATVDFGISVNASQCFDFLKTIQKGGPPVNSEFYPGWLAHWQEPHPKVTSDAVVRQMKSMLSLNASIKETLENAKHSGPVLENISVISPIPMLKAAYGTFHLQPLVSLFEEVTHRITPVLSAKPLTFESMDINTGFVMYETILLNKFENPVNLTVNSLRDRAIIYLDQVQVGTMNRLKGNTTIFLDIEKHSAQTLSILVENQGRINYGDFIEDRKGILGHVLLDNKIVGPWKDDAHPLNETSWLSSIKPVEHVQVPAFYRTQFTLPEDYTSTLDTYLDTSGWTKGVAFLNDINLGRYWPLAGPQITLYVPC
ncbi:unnamed protein product [Macrosiphum euphorbiae]|uniref:Beta-galactosidase n=1 Tax=Macrosiphum euphorbiae TaxID=13131 RepID=A0AAV0XJ45_9HEMI|nr:unnamed protein product [Macrosiphum euphorbiae]